MVLFSPVYVVCSDTPNLGLDQVPLITLQQLLYETVKCIKKIFYKGLVKNDYITCYKFIKWYTANLFFFFTQVGLKTSGMKIGNKIIKMVQYFMSRLSRDHSKPCPTHPYNKILRHSLSTIIKQWDIFTLILEDYKRQTLSILIG